MKLNFLFFIFTFCFTISCMPNRDNAILVQDQGREVIISEIEFIEDFLEIHSSPRVTISSFINNNPLHRKIQISGFLSTGFQVLVDFEILFKNAEKLTIDYFSTPEIYVTEILEINQLDDGRFRLRFSDSWKIDQSKVNALFAGDIQISELLGKFLRNERRVLGFEEFVQWREDHDR